MYKIWMIRWLQWWVALAFIGLMVAFHVKLRFHMMHLLIKHIEQENIFHTIKKKNIVNNIDIFNTISSFSFLLFLRRETLKCFFGTKRSPYTMYPIESFPRSCLPKLKTLINIMIFYEQRAFVPNKICLTIPSWSRK